MDIIKSLENYTNKPINTATKKEVFDALLNFTKEQIANKEDIAGERKLYYVSAEFLIGKLLSNNLINLGLYEEVATALQSVGLDIADYEDAENEPSLGNGGLGRLAACFLDSIASLGLNGDGIGLNYHLGLFKQKFIDNKQMETPNPWIENTSWLTKKEFTCSVEFKNHTVKSTLYDIDVIGYEQGRNQLHLFDIESVDERIVTDGITFDKTDIEKCLTLFLYPDDSDRNGHLLRIYQQYFMVSSGAQYILNEYRQSGKPIEDLAKYVCIQINDTHPSMIIPELIRLLTEVDGIEFNKAVEIVSNTCAYTNHTILAEALEKWSIDYLMEVVPQLMPIIKKLDAIIKAKYDDKRVQIIDDNNLVHMAHMDIHFGYSVNGVAYLHTEILKSEELAPFYALYKEKFNNKTNGITFRRWLLHSNKHLVKMLDNLIGTEYKHNAMELLKLEQYADEKNIQEQVLDMKQKCRHEFVEYYKAHTGKSIDEHAIIDVQVKRLHEYKRQQMNLLYAINKYMEIKAGKIPTRPITMIFGAKAAPAYITAKNIIHAILAFAEMCEKDSQVAPHLQVIMLENYNVSMAEKLIPSADISEQISLSSKEASGTGNMKFMLNGAITLGTLDGANVEINDLVGKDNIYIFGKESHDVIELYKNGQYNAREICSNDESINKLVNFLISDELVKYGDKELLTALYNEIIGKDYFMTLLDIKEYIAKKEELLLDYENRYDWARKMIINISKAGYFSSDRTIAEYNKDIWKLK